MGFNTPQKSTNDTNSPDIMYTCMTSMSTEVSVVPMSTQVSVVLQKTLLLSNPTVTAQGKFDASITLATNVKV